MKIDCSTYEAEKQKMLSRRRRVIFNNDGGDATNSAQDPDHPEKFLDKRTTPLRNSHVDTISYCTARGFGVFNIAYTREDKKMHGVIPALKEKGTDPLEVMVNFSHEHDIEVFWSMRMNDTHDAYRPPMFKCNSFKADHPEYLLGTNDDPPRIGGWSAVDYSFEKVRLKLLEYVREVCENYDIDGIELDFFRHPVFFKPTSMGIPVGDTERGHMTDLMRNIQSMIRETGMKRGRPLLIAVRTPDDVAYCNTIGLEIEYWMREGLIDIFIPSAYIRLNSWEYSVRLAHQYKVKVYPGLSESRVGGGHHANPLRSSEECYRARALNAWDAGADGIYTFNLYNPRLGVWSEMGEPDVLKPLDKFYFASVRGVGSVAGGSYPHMHFISNPTLNPDAPLVLKANEYTAIRVRMGEDFPEKGNGYPEIILHLKTNPGVAELKPVFNGHVLQGGPCEYGIEPQTARKGDNVVEVFNSSESDMEISDVMISIDFTGKALSGRSFSEETKKNM